MCAQLRTKLNYTEFYSNYYKNLAPSTTGFYIRSICIPLNYLNKNSSYHYFSQYQKSSHVLIFDNVILKDF